LQRRKDHLLPFLLERARARLGDNWQLGKFAVCSARLVLLTTILKTWAFSAVSEEEVRWMDNHVHFVGETPGLEQT